MEAFRIFLLDGPPIPAIESRAALMGFEIEGVFISPSSVAISGWTRIRQENGCVQTSDVSSGVADIGSDINHDELVSTYTTSVVNDYSKLFEPQLVAARTKTHTK